MRADRGQPDKDLSLSTSVIILGSLATALISVSLDQPERRCHVDSGRPIYHPWPLQNTPKNCRSLASSYYGQPPQKLGPKLIMHVFLMELWVRFPEMRYRDLVSTLLRRTLTK